MKTLAIVFAAAALVGGAACSSDASPSSDASTAFCSQLDATKQTFDDLQNVDVASSGASGLQTALAEVASSLEALGDEGSAAFNAQLAAVQTAVSSLETSVSAIDTSDLAGAAAEIGPELAALGSAVQGLVDDAGHCS